MITGGLTGWMVALMLAGLALCMALAQGFG